MAYSPAYLSSTHAYILPSKKKNTSKFYQSFQVRAQSYRDEANNIVDENLVVLRERIKEVKNKERLERCCQAEAVLGWNYNDTPAVINKKKNNLIRSKRAEESKFVETVGMFAATFGLTILTCTCCLSFAALLLHLN